MRATRAFTILELMIVVVLIGIIAALAIPSLLRSRMGSHEISAITSLKSLVPAEASWRQLDPDTNGKQDYWVLDVAGFYAVQDQAGNVLRNIDLSFAKADGSRVVSYSGRPAVPQPRSGYRFRAMTGDAAGAYCVNAIPTQTDPTLIPGGTLACNSYLYGFTASPDIYNASGIRTFILNEGGVVYGVDKGTSSFTPTWPGTDPTTETIGNRFWAASQ